MKDGIARVVFLLILVAVPFCCLDAQASGNALDFDGTDDFVTISSVLSATGTAATFEAWIYPTASSDVHIIVYHADNGEMSILVSGSILEVDVKLKDGNWYNAGVSISSINKWYHIAGVWEKGDSIRIYVNGSLGNSTNVPDYFLWDCESVTHTNIGSYNVGERELFQGKIDEVRLWNVARTQAEIQANMYKTLDGNESGLVGYWKFNESSGGTANDETSNNNDGTLQNMEDGDWVTSYAPLTSTSFVGRKCLDFDGTSEYISVPDHSSLDVTTNLTVEAWVNLDNADNDQKIVGKVKSTTDSGYLLGVYDGKLYVEIWDYTGAHAVFSRGNFSSGEWAHLAFTWSTNGNIIGYINGEAVYDSSATGNSIGTHDNNLIIGAAPWNQSEYFVDGKIDEVRIWSVVRTQAQIQTWMNKELTGSEPGLVGYWRFNEGTGITAGDSSTNSNNGTLTSMESSDWIDSDLSFNLASVWPANTSNSSSLMTIEDGEISSDHAIILNHNRATLSANTSDVPGTINRRLNRVWQVEVYSSLTGDIIFNTTGLGISAGDDLRLLEDDDGTFDNASPVTGAYSSSENTFTVTNHTVSDGNYYTLASTSTDNSLPVELSSFTAIAGNGQIALEWITESELDNLGFNIYRSTNANGQFSMINDQLIPGAGNSSSRHNYEFVDQDVKNGNTYWYKLEDVDFSGNTKMHGPVSATPLESATPKEFRLHPSYPNPFNAVTTIAYDLPEEGYVNLTVYNLRGETITTLVQGNQAAGSYRLQWDGKDQNGRLIPSGIYFLKIASGSFVRTHKMVFMR